MGGLYFLLGFLIKSVLFNAHPDARYLLSLIKPLVIVKPRPCCPTGAGSVGFFFFFDFSCVLLQLLLGRGVRMHTGRTDHIYLELLMEKEYSRVTANL